MVFLITLSKRFQKSCTCSPNIGCFRLHVTNVTVSYVLPFFERLNWNFIFDCLTIFMFDIRWKYTCVQIWKQSMGESKAYKYKKVICFSNPMFAFSEVKKYIIKCSVDLTSDYYPWLLNRYHRWFGRCKYLLN